MALGIFVAFELLVATCGIHEQFPDQGLNLGPLHWECNRSHWTTKEIPIPVCGFKSLTSRRAWSAAKAYHSKSGVVGQRSSYCSIRLDRESPGLPALPWLHSSSAGPHPIITGRDKEQESRVAWTIMMNLFLKFLLGLT